MKKQKNSKKVMSLFSKDAIEKIRNERFNGALSVIWENGVIKDLKLSTCVRACQGDFFMDDC